MASPLKIVGLGGSMAAISRSRAALDTALEGAKAADAQTELLDLRELDLPMYNPDEQEPTAAAARVIEACTQQTGSSGAARSTRGRSPARSRTRSTGCTCSAIGIAVSPGQGDRPDQRRGRDTGPAGDQHDGVLRARTSCVGRPLRRPGGGGWRESSTEPAGSSTRRSRHSSRLLGSEVVRVAERFVVDEPPDHAAECAHAGERVASAGPRGRSMIP